MKSGASASIKCLVLGFVFSVLNNSYSQHCLVCLAYLSIRLLESPQGFSVFIVVSVTTVTESTSLKFRTGSAVIRGDVLRCLCGVMRFIDGIPFYLHRQARSLDGVVYLCAMSRTPANSDTGV